MSLKFAPRITLIPEVLNRSHLSPSSFSFGTNWSLSWLGMPCALAMSTMVSFWMVYFTSLIHHTYYNGQKILRWLGNSLMQVSCNLSNVHKFYLWFDETRDNDIMLTQPRITKADMAWAHGMLHQPKNYFDPTWKIEELRLCLDSKILHS